MPTTVRWRRSLAPSVPKPHAIPQAVPECSRRNPGGHAATAIAGTSSLSTGKQRNVGHGYRPGCQLRFVGGVHSRLPYQSRTQFHRLFRSVVEETPAAMRRRLLLERAAYQLGSSGMSVTDIALDANYGSLEAFTRAFRTKAARNSTGCSGV